jgi:hypothetical protein
VFDFNLADWLSIVGFVIAIWQIRRAASISEETQAVLKSASETAGIYAVLLLASRAERCEAQFETSILQGERAQALDRLREWRTIAAELVALLPQVSERTDLANPLNESVQLAVLAQRKVKGLASDADLVKTVERISESMSLAAVPVASVAAQLRTDLNRQPEPAARSRWFGRRDHNG